MKREQERERIAAPFVVHHVERILFLLLSLLIANADAFAPSLSLSDISSSSRARPTLTYEEKSAYIHTHILTQTLGHASFHIYAENDVKLLAAC